MNRSIRNLSIALTVFSHFCLVFPETLNTRNIIHFHNLLVKDSTLPARRARIIENICVPNT